MVTFVKEVIVLFLTKFKFISIYFGIKRYLPRKRFKEFNRSWVINHFVRAPIQRKKLEKINNCVLPFIINISPSEKCNLSCMGCYASNYKKDKEMTVEEFRSIVKQASDLQVSMIGILGGEPLMRKDILNVISEFKHIAFRISSNGTLIDNEIVTFLKNNGNVVITFSIEGYGEETNKWREDGVYESIMRNMERLKNEKVLFGISVLIHDKNKDLIASHKFFRTMQELGNRFALFFPYGPAGKNQMFDKVISEVELEKYVTKIFRISRSYPIITLAEGYFIYFMNRKSKMAFECTSGRNLHVTPEGYLEPCNGIQFYKDNIFEKGLIDSLKSPFLSGIRNAVSEKNKCIAIYRPGRILEIVKTNKANKSHNLSQNNNERYIEYLINNNQPYN